MATAVTMSTVPISSPEATRRSCMSGPVLPTMRHPHGGRRRQIAPLHGVLLALVLLFGPIPAAQAAAIQPGMFATTTTWLNVRASPSLNAAVLQVLPPGAQVYVNSGPYDAVWYQITYYDTTGYVHGAYLTPVPASNGDPILVGAGDIATCSGSGDEATAALLDGIPGTVFTTGDHVYPDGTAAQFAECYAPSWGRHKARTRPAPGNHDYHTPGAAGYFTHFGAAAGDPRQGYYSYDLGRWHIIVLNSNCDQIGGCQPGSPQERWLRADLQAHPATCTLAYWHHPLFSSGSHGNQRAVQPLWQALYDAGADVVINGHDHNYERFAPQDPSGERDDARGIRAFVVGTGGTSFRPFATIQANSEVRNSDTHGVLKLTLHAASYDWKFVPAAGQPFTDAGSTACH